MSNGSTNKIPLLLAGLALLGLAGFFFFQWQKADALRTMIARELDDLPKGVTGSYGKIDVPLFGGPVVISTLAYTFESQAGPFDYTLDRIELTGINPAAFKDNTGTIRLFDALCLYGSRLSGPGMKVRVDEYLLEEVDGDAAWIKREYKKTWPFIVDLMTISPDVVFEQPEKMTSLFRSLSDLLKAMETARIGRVFAKGQTVDFDPALGLTMGMGIPPGLDLVAMTLAIDSMEARDYTLRGMGPLRMRSMNFSQDGKARATCAEAGWDKVTLPSYAELFAILGEPEVAAVQQLAVTKIQELLSKQIISVTNIYTKDLRILDDNSQAPARFSLADASLNFSMHGNRQDITLRFSGASIPKTLLVKESEGALPADALALLPENLVFEGDLDNTVTSSSEYVFSVDNRQLRFKMQDVGEVSCSLAAENLNLVEVLGGLPRQGTLSRFTLSLTDLKGGDLIASLLAAKEPGETPEGIRAQAVAEVTAIAQGLPEGPFRLLADNLAGFLSKSGGTFEVAIQPPGPLPLHQAMGAFPAEPEMLGLSSSFAPAAADK